MKKLEEKSRKRKKKSDMQALILGTVVVAGALSVALVAPNVIGAMAKMGMLVPLRHKESINRARGRLLQRGWLRKDDRGFLRMTPQGERGFFKMQALKHGLQKPKRWDGKWRILIFDIPDYRKTLRERLRRSLRAVGFILFQKSVWIYPYDCEDFVALLKADFKIGKDLRYIIADAVEGDQKCREHFGV